MYLPHSQPVCNRSTGDIFLGLPGAHNAALWAVNGTVHSLHFCHIGMA
jgi:hypothetical protein